MKNLPLFVFVFLLIGNSLLAQTPISGVVNAYAKVTNISTVNNSVSVVSNSVFSTGDKVLIIQMKGASIDDSQSAMFGAITNLNNCGNFEFQTICEIQGTTITFNHKLLNNYSSNGAVQLIKVATYQSAIISGNDLLATPWTGDFGGVLVLEAETLNFGSQNIDLTGSGFKGGIAQISGQNCNFLGDFSYYTSALDPDANARKGEGIAAFIINRECSRGPQANGGGGGNNHNGGGSGGANFGFGGAGGKRIKKSTFLCGSENGLNSYALSAGYTANKIFLGGGGGAGHGNNSGIIGESGLNGGGIVILNVGTLIGNGQSIFANGEASLTDANGDGAGGGGAGGTVLISANNVSSTLNVEVNGSNGINTNNSGSSNCSGPGGGAGGGVIWISGASNPTNLNPTFLGGSAGIIATTSQSNCSVGSTNGGQNGATGAQLFNLVLPTGNVIFASKTLTENACGPFTSPSGNYVWDSTGTYFDTIYGVGCDSTFVINLTVTEVDTAITISNGVLTSVVSGGSYQWFDCENFTPISSANGQSYAPTSSGFYALVVTENSCIDTSNCHRVIPVGIISTGFNSSLNVFPNPTNGKFTLDLGSNNEPVSVIITTLSGQVVFSKKMSKSRTFEIDLAQPQGVYLLKIESNTGKMAVIKLVKE